MLVPQALGSDEFLRVTWHEDRAVMVFSHWDGAECVAATPVHVKDLDELADLVGTAVGADRATPPAWPAPLAEHLVVPAAGLCVPPARLTA